LIKKKAEVIANDAIEVSFVEQYCELGSLKALITRGAFVPKSMIIRSAAAAAASS
jgi:hypothetical protein